LQQFEAEECIMAEQKPCVRCERLIDSSARSCVYCGWDQALPKPVETAAAPLAHPYVPPPDNRVRNRLIGAGAFIVLVIIAFFGASLIHRFDAKEAASAAQNTTAAAASPEGSSKSRTTVVLVPVDGDGAMQDQPPVTSAPAQQAGTGTAPVNVDRTDATALPSEAYSIAARRARAERDIRPNNGIIDPRTIAGGVDAGPNHSAAPPPAVQRAERVVRVARTQPVPLYQPVPPMQVYREANARLILTVGTEGRVRDINIARSIPGEMPRLIAAVQNWRFRPATENGQPVTSTFAVDITVRPR
jgi:hypothetical protein